jgi:16S rRNA U516 pseudouridylate synthase RsuA-like enzyme
MSLLIQVEEASLVESLAAGSRSRVRLGVMEGKYRMVRRILHNAGHSVIDLHRAKYGGLVLGDLCAGAVRRCTDEETEWGRALLKTPSRALQN